MTAIYEGLGVTDSQGRDNTGECNEQFNNLLTAATEEFNTSQTFRTKLVEGVIQSCIDGNVQSAIDQVHAYEDACESYAVNTYDSVIEMGFSESEATKAQQQFYVEHGRAVLRDLQVGDTLIVERSNVNRCQERQTKKKIRTIMPIGCEAAAKVLIVWGTGDSLRVHRLDLFTGDLLQMTESTPTEYRVLWTEKGKKSAGDDAGKISNSNSGHAK